MKIEPEPVIVLPLLHDLRGAVSKLQTEFSDRNIHLFEDMTHLHQEGGGVSFCYTLLIGSNEYLLMFSPEYPAFGPQILQTPEGQDTRQMPVEWNPATSSEINLYQALRAVETQEMVAGSRREVEPCTARSSFNDSPADSPQPIESLEECRWMLGVFGIRELISLTRQKTITTSASLTKPQTPSNGEHT